MKKSIDPTDDIKLGKDFSTTRFRVVNSSFDTPSKRAFFNKFIEGIDLNRKKIWYPRPYDFDGYALVSDYHWSKTKGHTLIANARFKVKLVKNEDKEFSVKGSWLTMTRIPFEDEHLMKDEPKTKTPGKSPMKKDATPKPKATATAKATAKTTAKPKTTDKAKATAKPKATATAKTTDKPKTTTKTKDK